MLVGIKNLASGKAIGVDGLADTMLKNVLKDFIQVREKTRLQFEKWINGAEELPQYLKTAKTMFLSKEDSEFPEVGNVRIISMLCATVKLWEQILHTKLKEDIAIKAPISA